jgi:hypothetical protein
MRMKREQLFGKLAAFGQERLAFQRLARESWALLTIDVEAGITALELVDLAGETKG